MGSLKRKYLLIDEKRRYRRNSAPERLPANMPSPYDSDSSDRLRSRASVADFSVLLETEHSDSSSSLEIDTSNLSREMTPVPNYDSSSCRDSYQNLPSIINFQVYRRNNGEDSFLASICSWAILKPVLLTQLMSICLTVMEVVNIYLRDLPYDIFTLGQNLPCYLLLSIIWTSQLAWRDEGRGIAAIFKLSGLRYILLAALHVEAHYLLLSSFQQSSFIGNQVIDCVAASLSLVLVYVCLEAHIHLTSILGFGCAMLGALGLCAANVLYGRDGASDEVSWGDILRIASGLFLAFNTLAQELIVKSIDSVEYLGMVGFMGSFICGLQVMTAEWDHDIPYRLDFWLAVSTFTAMQVAISCLAPCVLRDSSTVAMHLGLITSSFYIHLTSALLGREQLEGLYVVSYVVVLIGSFTFTMRRVTVTKHYFFPVKVVITKGS